MSSGKPDWAKLQQMGKLPENQRSKVPMLAQLDQAEKRLEEIQSKLCDDCNKKVFGIKPSEDLSISIVCKTQGCEYVSKGKSEAQALLYMKNHSKSHLPKE